MIKVLKKIWDFAGIEQKHIKKSIIIGIFYAIFHMLMIGAIFFAVEAVVNESHDVRYIFMTFFMVLLSIVGRIVCNYSTQLHQTHAGYFMSAWKRIDIGNRLKTIPMGFFNENSLGEITGIATTVLQEVETTVPMVLVITLTGIINALIFIVYIFFFDYRIGFIVLLGTICYFFITSKMEKKSSMIAPKRQRSTAKLVEAVLENIKGMFIVRSFNLSENNHQNIDEAIENNRASNLAMERLFTPYTIAQEIILKLFSIFIILAAIQFYWNKTMSLTYCLMMIIVSFLIFAQIQSAGSGLAILRLAGSSIDHANKVDETPVLDEHGKEINPENQEIVFNDVSFSYDKREILHHVQLTIPHHSSLAIVGPSGSGKSTLCHLIARFWDVNKGSISIGGHDIRDYTLESLMDQISMVFQNVYLFNDTVENNIKFSRPEATLEDVKKAAQKACCDEFIESLPEGYQTVIGEGGSSLSGGEKQRISIARAILKDAPIIIFDEVTANVDPENEDKLQRAMEELMKDKTVIMIAHRLKTVKHASKIIVINNGQIVQQGTHQQLIKEDGLYKKFVEQKNETSSWKL